VTLDRQFDAERMMILFGSPKAVALKELVKKVRHLFGDKVDINQSKVILKSKPSILVPTLELAQSDMGLRMQFDIDAALLRTIQWYIQLMIE
jgi:nucleoside-diphosphate-sugar epimerase